MLTCLVGVQIELDAFRGALLPTRSGAVAGYAIDFADFSQLTPPLAVNYQGQNGVGADWRSWTVGSDRCNFQTLCHALNGLPLGIVN
ncbi:MAG TPA: hypothetical protein IGS53_27925 [Leptolyngbyaceae cyanobacterium M33_DOE_097]|uniref:Uncharacterized protein n=1 Tax=Oscillatoriales cyanobacterium SpSt-418 TaxID=2282169 RepID=A0A7C3PE18_9CYAN|nr:hypothetical protein [Leptolyngbyaceae cyanobacterium M33_DOE_097]